MSYLGVKKIIAFAAAILSFSVASTPLSRSSNGQDDDTLKNVMIAPTDWDSLKSIQMVDSDCGPGAKDTSCDSKLPKPKTTEEASGLVVASECYNASNLPKVVAAYKPCYPVIAAAAHASGTVDVLVVVDESGDVTWAHALKGHPLLQSAAVKAACKWRFQQDVCAGKKRIVNRIIPFDFVAPE